MSTDIKTTGLPVSTPLVAPPPEPRARLGKTSGPRLLFTLIQAQALDLRKQGLSYVEIGERLGISSSKAYEAVRRAVEKVETKVGETAGEIKRVELERLDKMFNTLFPEAQKGNIEAVDKCLKIMERRARFLGLDTPSGADSGQGRVVKVELKWGGQDVPGNGNSGSGKKS